MKILHEQPERHYKLKDHVYLLESKKGDYRIIYPIKKDLSSPLTTKNTHWFNFLTGGSTSKLLSTLLVLALLLFALWSYNHDTQACRDLIENPPSCGLQGDNRFLVNISEDYEGIIPLPPQNDGGADKK